MLQFPSIQSDISKASEQQWFRNKYTQLAARYNPEQTSTPFIIDVMTTANTLSHWHL